MIKTRGGRLLQPDAFSRSFADLRIGARVRGVEATVHGHFERCAADYVLRIPDTAQVLRLMPLTRKVQLDSRRQEPEEVSDTERKAYERLLAKWKGAPLAVQVVGPLSRDSEGALLLQVRQWKLSKPVQFRAVRQP